MITWWHADYDNKVDEVFKFYVEMAEQRGPFLDYNALKIQRPAINYIVNDIIQTLICQQ